MAPVGDSARAFWVTGPGVGEIRSERLEPPSAGDVVVRALYSGISRGTESLVFQGRVPPGEFERMRAPFQSGSFPSPVKYGYASVGRVEQGPADVKGRDVFALFPHQTRYVIPASAVHLVPANIPPARAVLAANLETAVNALWDGRPHVGDRIVVIGGGTVGCLVAWLAGRMPGADVTLVDVNADRSPVASALGVRFALPDRVADGADVVLHASGSPAGLELALRIAAFEATIVELSWYGTQSVPLPLGEAFHARRLTLKSSQVGSIADSQRARWDAKRRMMLALGLLSDATLDVLISGESEFETLPSVMTGLAVNPAGALCHRIRYT
jgi:2-desacetyl-2-hydroxyethyl bacteriochlorophyllide A dehydrogenase